MEDKGIQHVPLRTPSERPLPSPPRLSPQAISVHCGLLLLAVASVLLPSMLVATHTQVVSGVAGGAADDPSTPSATLASTSFPSSSSSLTLSRFESVFMLMLYAMFLVFQLCTHK